MLTLSLHTYYAYFNAGIIRAPLGPDSITHATLVESHVDEDTKALVCSLQVPEVHSKIVGREVRAVITVHRDGVNVIRVCIRKNPSGHCFY